MSEQKLEQILEGLPDEGTISDDSQVDIKELIRK